MKISFYLESGLFVSFEGDGVVKRIPVSIPEKEFHKALFEHRHMEDLIKMQSNIPKGCPCVVDANDGSYHGVYFMHSQIDGNPMFSLTEFKPKNTFGK
jgi:hypothetical protein